MSGRFPHTPILPSTYSSWTKKTLWRKQKIALGTKALFWNSVGLYGNISSCFQEMNSMANSRV